MSDKDQFETFARNLKQFRIDAGMTQQDLAELTDVSMQSIHRWESMSSRPTSTAAMALARALGRPLEDFFLEDPPTRIGPPATVRFKIIGEVTDEVARRIEEFQRNINDELLERVGRLKREGRKGRKL